MPDAVSVTDAFVVDEEVDAGAVDDAAHDEPGSSPCGQCVNQRANGNKREPAHQHVEQHGDDAGAPAQRELLSNAECSKPPLEISWGYRTDNNESGLSDDFHYPAR